MTLIPTAALKRIAKQHGTPSYVYFADAFHRQAKLLASSLPNGFKLFYAMKANSHPEVVKIFSGTGLGVEVSSIGELSTALSCKVPASKIVFAGPGKRVEELEAAVRACIHCIHAESFAELERINGVCGRLKKTARVALRINPLSSASGAGQKMGGESRQFGIDEELLTKERLLSLSKLQDIRIVGIHVYASSQLLSQAEFLQNTENVFRIAKRLSASIPITYLDVGGGFGIPYNSKQKPFSLAGLKKRLFSLVKMYSLEHAEICVESGRFLAGPAGAFLATVVDVKRSRGKGYAVLDAGINAFLRPALARAFHLAQNLSKRPRGKTTLVGPLCTPWDVVGELSTTALPGDVVAISQAGAYGFSESMPLFLSHGLPAEVLVEKGKARLITRRLSGHELSTLLH